jgi:diaminopimelate decarboxylase
VLVATTMNQETYSPPVIRKLGHGGGNPHRHGRSRTCPRIDGVAVEELLGKFGSPLFVFSEATLRERIRAAREAFESRYPDVCFAWSYKTNYLDAVCRVFHDEGSIAEVVSDFEYEKARHNGMPGDQIIFNGPWKSEQALNRAVGEGALIQVDHRDEMLALMRIGKQRGEPVRWRCGSTSIPAPMRRGRNSGSAATTAKCSGW